MVQSGLVDDPRVSPFRLTAHLGLAFLIFAAMFWIALSLLTGSRDAPRWRAQAQRAPFFVHDRGSRIRHGAHRRLRRRAFARASPTTRSRSMNGHVVPPEIMMLVPWWKNFFYNMATVQFDHRLLAWIACVPGAGAVVERAPGRWRPGARAHRRQLAGRDARRADRARHPDAREWRAVAARRGAPGRRAAGIRLRVEPGARLR